MMSSSSSDPIDADAAGVLEAVLDRLVGEDIELLLLLALDVPLSGVEPRMFTSPARRIAAAMILAASAMSYSRLDSSPVASG